MNLRPILIVVCFGWTSLAGLSYAQAPQMAGWHSMTPLNFNLSVCHARAQAALLAAGFGNLTTQDGWTATATSQRLRASISCVEINGRSLVDIVVAAPNQFGAAATSMRDRLKDAMLGRASPDIGTCTGDGDYEVFTNQAILGKNKTSQYDSSVEQCKPVCNRTSWCKSFEFNRNERVCHFQDVDRADVALTSYSGTDHYAKICQSEQQQQLPQVVSNLNASPKARSSVTSKSSMLTIPPLLRLSKARAIVQLSSAVSPGSSRNPPLVISLPI